MSGRSSAALALAALSNRRIGGVLLGRDAAIDSLLDMPACGVGAVPAAPNPACDGSGLVAPELTRGPDTLELLRIEDGRATVLARDNPDP